MHLYLRAGWRNWSHSFCKWQIWSLTTHWNLFGFLISWLYYKNLLHFSLFLGLEPFSFSFSELFLMKVTGTILKLKECDAKFLEKIRNPSWLCRTFLTSGMEMRNPKWFQCVVNVHICHLKNNWGEFLCPYSLYWCVTHHVTFCDRDQRSDKDQRELRWGNLIYLYICKYIYIYIYIYIVIYR